MFLLANVVDDIEMGITHVVRGDEHLPNTPKQQLLWEALGAAPPVWAHVPVLVNEQRKKLSKRRDKVALEQYRDEGYLADAMVNYLMTLGWAPKHTGDGARRPRSCPGTRSRRTFRLEDVTHSPAFFDLKKLGAVQRRVHPHAAASTSSSPPASRGSRRTTTGPCSRRWPRTCRRGWSRSPMPRRWSTS